MNFAFKEAYMKFTGTPDWDQLGLIEFIGIQLPSKDEVLVNAVSTIFVSNNPQSAYTECHNVADNYIIAIYTSIIPDHDDTKFEEIRLERIIAASNIEI